MRTAHRSRRSIPPRSAFAGFRFPSDVIVLAVRWYLRFGLSYRDVEELLAERGIQVDHVTVYRWVQRFTPLAVVKIGSGIGCGLFINNELERGNSGLAGELGHIPSEPEGQRCSCGNWGCPVLTDRAGGSVRLLV